MIFFIVCFMPDPGIKTLNLQCRTINKHHKQVCDVCGFGLKFTQQIIIQCYSPHNMTVEQCRKIISCCLLCPCIMDKVRKLNTADSPGCLCPMETCSFKTCILPLYTLLLHTAVTSWMLRHTKQPAPFVEYNVRLCVMNMCVHVQSYLCIDFTLR